MDKVTLLKRKTASAEWAERIRECRNSGATVAQWCESNGINPKTYYYHLRKLREQICEQIPVPVQAYEENPSVSFAVTVRDASGISVEIADGTSPATIEAVIRALKC